MKVAKWQTFFFFSAAALEKEKKERKKSVKVIAEDLGFCLANHKCNWNQPGRIQLQQKRAGVK